MPVSERFSAYFFETTQQVVCTTVSTNRKSNNEVGLCI